MIPEPEPGRVGPAEGPMEIAPDFASVAVQLGRTTRERVAQARAEQDRTFLDNGQRLFLAEVLLRLGAIGYDDVADVLDAAQGYREEAIEHPRQVRFGDLAIWKGYVTPLQVFVALQEQRDDDAAGRPHRYVGDVLVERGWLSPWELEDVLVSMADVSYSQTRTGHTPSDAIPVGGRKRGRRARAVTAIRGRRVVEVMSGAVAVGPLARAADVRALVEDLGLAHVVVLAGPELRGVIDAADLPWVPGDALAGAVCRPTPTLTVHDSLEEAARALREAPAGAVAVVSGGIVVGLVTCDDLRGAGLPAPRAPAGTEGELGGSD